MKIALASGLAPARAALSNGAVVLAQSTSMAPAVTIHLTFEAGSQHDPADRPGLAHLMGRVLDQGTDTRSGDRISEELDDRGVALQVTTTRELLMLSCTCLRDDFDDVLAIVMDVARHPVFPQRALGKRLRETVTALRQDADNPSVLAVDALADELYGSQHPYGRKVKGTIEGIHGATTAELSRLHGLIVRPLTAVLTIVGDIAAERALSAATSLLDDWSAPPACVVPIPAPAPVPGRQVRHVDMPGKAQSDIAYGFVAIRRHDPRYHAYSLMNNILGQFGIGGRLADNIRERQGMAYYAYSSFDPSVADSPLIIRAGVDPANVQRTVDAIDEEVRRFGEHGPTDAEMSETKEYLVGSVARLLETNQSIASFLQHAEQFGLGLDHDRRLPDEIRAVTIDDVSSACAELLRVDRAALAVAGPSDQER